MTRNKRRRLMAVLPWQKPHNLQSAHAEIRRNVCLRTSAMNICGKMWMEQKSSIFRKNKNTRNHSMHTAIDRVIMMFDTYRYQVIPFDFRSKLHFTCAVNAFVLKCRYSKMLMESTWNVALKFIAN